MKNVKSEKQRNTRTGLHSQILILFSPFYCYNIENRAAHRAYHDALATAKLYQTLAHYFEADDPKLFQPVQLTYRVKKPQPATIKQIALLNNLIRKKRADIKWNPAAITRSEASRLIEELLKK